MMLKNILDLMRSARSLHPLFFFSRKEKTLIVRAIREAEMKTSGEIRVHLQQRTKPDILAHGKEVFENLGMAKTELRNGVLIFIGTQNRRFAILADRGIHQNLEPLFWDDLARRLEDYFKRDCFADGILEAVSAVGEHLKKHFPRERDDSNELPDAISYAV